MNDLAIATLALFERVKLLISDAHDYGEVTGFCNEFDRITSDLTSALQSIGSRLSSLERRVTRLDKYTSADELLKDLQSVGLLKKITPSDAPADAQEGIIYDYEGKPLRPLG